MITLTCTRHHADYAMLTIFRYQALWRQSQFNNVKDFAKTSGEYLTVRLFNCLLAEVEYLFERKLDNRNPSKIPNKSAKINIKMSHAQGIAFYRMLLTLPLSADDYYLMQIRNRWIEIIDQQILKL
jgi:hypothetical protein